ncbi:MAG: SusC/RagA family TonB-linked outer membrane protein, partial [Bacteroidales bacterium]|nr:SusC/RagA family TonB-linked outer membrane protein [Bacteroidales bacterium]
VASFIGLSEKEVTLENAASSPCAIVLEEDQNYLNEVVVVGYGTQKKVNVTGAVGVVDGKELAMRPVNSAAQALQGADPSLLLTSGSGGIEGSEYSVTIRGSVSINSGSPLILIDGVEGSLSQVNPNDIESVSVLKDASACAIYGAKASAGVVLINTKNGGSGQAKINYNGRVSLVTNTTSTDFITSGYDHVTLCNEFYEYFKGYGAWTFSDEQIEMMKERRYDVTEHPDRPWVIPDETGTYTYLYLGNFDWYDFLFKQTRPETEHNISVRGGNDKVKYYVSGRYLYKEGIFDNAAEDIYNSFSLRSKIDAKITNWLTYSNSLSFERMLYDYGGFWELDGTSGIVDAGIIWNLTQNVTPAFTPWNPDGTVNMYPGYMADATSPIFSGRGGVFTDGRNQNKRTKNYLTMTNRFTFDIVKGLKFIADYTYRRRDNVESYRSLPTANAYDNINKRLYVNPDTSLPQGAFTNGSVYDFYRESRYYQDGHVINAFFTYDQTFGNHSVTATLGGNFDDYSGSTLMNQQKGSLSESLAFIGLMTNEAGTNNIEKASQSISSYRTLGFFARLNYNFKGKYLVEFSGRYDGSSRFPAGQRWGFFPSASAGWKISEEPFFKPLKGWWNMA